MMRPPLSRDALQPGTRRRTRASCPRCWTQGAPTGAGPAAVAKRQRARLADLIAFTRTRSPFYRQLYARLPECIEDPSLLPVTSKRELLARFDEIVTDHRGTRQAVEAFVADTTLIGQPFLNAYTVATTSGTTGIRGMFLIDQQALVVATAMAGRMLASWLRPRDALRVVAGSGRTAMVSASGGHFASAAAAARLRNPRRGARTVRLFPVQTPLTSSSRSSTPSVRPCSPPSRAPPLCWPANSRTCPPCSTGSPASSWPRSCRPLRPGSACVSGRQPAPTANRSGAASHRRSTDCCARTDSTSPCTSTGRHRSRLPVASTGWSSRCGRPTSPRAEAAGARCPDTRAGPIIAL